VPELPEVETIRRGLAPHVEGRTLQRLEVVDERWSRPLTPVQIADATEGRRIERLNRRGKYLILDLADEVFLTMHLRMTGTLLLDADRQTPHTRVTFALGEHTLSFVDPRRFGTGELQLGDAQHREFLDARLGLEPFDPAFDGAHLRTLARGRRAPVKAFLLDQTRIAGVGNIYADEALFRARIHPLRPVGTLKRAQLDALAEAVVASLQAGIDAKGATIDDFRDPYGVQGSFQDQFLVHLREGRECPVCGATIVKLRAAGRGTYVCPRCQRAPAAARRRRAAPAPGTRRY
jgi:formamidopyrimidine-DNA glycosylase